VGERETVALGTRLPDVSAPPPTDAFEISPEAAAAVFEAVEETAQMRSRPAAEPTVAMPEPPAPPLAAAEEELDHTTVLAGAQELHPTVKMDAPAPPAEPPPTLPPVPHFFEDETSTPTPPPMAPVPEPAPVPPAAVPAAKPAAPKPAAPAAASTSGATRIEARPAAPRARTAPAARPAPPPEPARRPEAAKGGGSSAGLIAGLAVVGLIVLAGAGYVAWRFLKPPAATPTPVPVAQVTPTVRTPPPTTLPAVETPPPTQEAAPAPEMIVEETVPVMPATPPPTTLAKALPTPTPPGAKPTPSPPAAKTPAPKAGASPTLPAGPGPEQLKAQRVTELLTQADAALAARRFDEASGLYGQALELEPGSARAREGRTAAQSGAAAARRTFVPGRTMVQGGRQSGSGAAGFEGAEVAKAPDYSGRIEFEASPRTVSAGESYSVRVFLLNDGKKSFKIGSITAITLVNGERSGGGPVSAPTREVKPQGRVQLQEIPGVWQEGVNSWALEVTVTSDRNDVFKNTLAWR
jgi:hypothetical protein